jgi:hypothetical protein
MPDQEKKKQRHDSRTTLRYPLEVTAMVIPDSEDRKGIGAYHLANTQNISAGGVYLNFSKPIETGTRLYIEIHTPVGRDKQTAEKTGWLKITAYGTVTRCTADGVGIQFVTKPVLERST